MTLTTMVSDVSGGGKPMDHGLTDEQLQGVRRVLGGSGVIAYPTEGVFGLGCDPFDEAAVSKLLEVKQRDQAKGLILIAANWAQVEGLVQPVSPVVLARVFGTWPGAVTWVFPASPAMPRWVRGRHNTVALRIPGHPVARAICEAFGGPVVSTSANVEGAPPVRELRALKMLFSDKIDLVVPGRVGTRLRPSEIRDALSGEVLRQG